MLHRKEVPFQEVTGYHLGEGQKYPGHVSMVVMCVLCSPLYCMLADRGLVLVGRGCPEHGDHDMRQKQPSSTNINPPTKKKMKEGKNINHILHLYNSVMLVSMRHVLQSSATVSAVRSSRLFILPLMLIPNRRIEMQSSAFD